MFRKIMILFVLVPLALVIAILAAANRHEVTVFFDPFLTADPTLSARVPLFVLAFAFALAGVIAGGVATWVGQGRWRRAARRADFQSRELRAEIEALRRMPERRASLALPNPAHSIRSPAA